MRETIVKIILRMTTVLDSITAILGVLAGIGTIWAANNLAPYLESSKEFMTNVDSSSVTAGYEVLAGLAGLALTGLGVLFFYAFAILAIAVAINFFIPSVVGIITWIREKSAIYTKGYFVDAVVKTIFHGIPTGILIWGAVEEGMRDIDVSIFLIAFVFLAFTVANLWAAIDIHKNLG